MTDGQTPNKTILVVEDVDDIRLMICAFLKRKGYEVLEAVDGQEAIASALREVPRLIIMDLNLPRLDGISAVRAIRGFPELQQTVILANSAYGELGMDLFLSLGEEGAKRIHYFTKPIRFEELDDLLNRFLPLTPEL